jgi:hypothetical protein
MALAEVSNSPPSPEPSVQESQPLPWVVYDVRPGEGARPAEVGAAPAASAPPAPPQDAPAAPIRLVGLHDALEGREWWFPKAFMVGRVPEADLVFAAPSVSRKHAYLWRQPAGWWVADLNSTHGTFVDGNRIGLEPVGPLRPGAVVQFGTVSLRVGEVDRSTRS